jgi:hypothetical protein
MTYLFLQMPEKRSFKPLFASKQIIPKQNSSLIALQQFDATALTIQIDQNYFLLFVLKIVLY